MSTHLTRSTAPFHRPGGHGCARTWQGRDWPPAGSRGQTRASRSVSGSPCGAHPTRQAWPPCEGTGPAARPRSARRTGRAGGPIRLTQETAPAPDGSLLVLVGFRPRKYFGDAWTRFATFRTKRLLGVCGGQTFGHRGPERRGAGPCYETLVWPVSATAGPGTRRSREPGGLPVLRKSPGAAGRRNSRWVPLGLEAWRAALPSCPGARCSCSGPSLLPHPGPSLEHRNPGLRARCLAVSRQVSARRLPRGLPQLPSDPLLPVPQRVCLFLLIF